MNQIIRVSVYCLCALLVLLTGSRALAGSLPPVSSLGWVYWVDTSGNAIKRAHYGSRGLSDVETLFNSVDDGVIAPKDLSLDVAASHIYWTQGPPNQIRRGNMDGSGSPVLLATQPAGFVMSSIVLDIAAGKVYWFVATAPTGKLFRANMAPGAPIEDVVTLAAPTAGSLAFDPVARMMYWGLLPEGSCASEGRIQRANVDGKLTIENVVTGLTFVQAIAIDHDGGWLMWSEFNCGVSTLSRIPLGGGPVRPLASGVRITSMAVDSAADKLYRTEEALPGMPTMLRSNVDGTDVETLGTESQFLGGITLVPPPCAPGDFNCDGHVNGVDLAILLAQWTGASTYPSCPPTKATDMNQDCKINGIDLALLLAAWAP